MQFFIVRKTVGLILNPFLKFQDAVDEFYNGCYPDGNDGLVTDVENHHIFRYVPSAKFIPSLDLSNNRPRNISDFNKLHHICEKTRKTLESKKIYSIFFPKLSKYYIAYINNLLRHLNDVINNSTDDSSLKFKDGSLKQMFKMEIRPYNLKQVYLKHISKKNIVLTGLILLCSVDDCN